jgi:cytochrome c553
LEVLVNFKSWTLALASISLAACGGSSGGGGTTDGGAGATGDAGLGPVIMACQACHGADLAGGATGPNITPMELGGWTDAQIEAALRTGVDEEGAPLCVTMPKYTTSQISAAQMTALIAYLKSVPAKTGPTVPPCSAQ